MFVVPLLALKPHWFSGRLSTYMIGTSLLSRILANILPAMESRVMSSQNFPSCSYTGL